MQKNRRGKKEPVIREIKSYVYSVTPHILWSGAKCGVLEGKQIACPGTRLCLFLLLSLESHKQMWALTTNVQLKTGLRWFISFMVDCRNTSSYLQEVFQSAAGTCQEPRSLLLTSRVVPCSYILNLGWSLYIFLCLLSTPTVSNMVTVNGGFYLSLTGPVVSLSQLRSPPISSTQTHTHTHTHCLHGRQTHSCHTVSVRQKASHRPTPPRFSQLTVKFWVSRAGRSSHPSCLLTHVTNEKRDKRDFHIKGWRAHLQFLRRLAAWVHQSTQAQRRTHAHIWLTQEKAFFNDLICCIFHGSHQHLFCVRSHYSFPPPFNQLHCMQSVLYSVYVPSQCSRAQVTTVLLS